MTLNALKFERKEEKKHHPRVLFRIVEVDSDEQPRLPAGHRCEGPTPRASALATQREPARATESRERRRRKLHKHMQREQAQGVMRAPGRPQGYRGHRLLGTLQRPGLCKHEIKTMASLALQRDKCLS